MVKSCVLQHRALGYQCSIPLVLESSVPFQIILLENQFMKPRTKSENLRFCFSRVNLSTKIYIRVLPEKWDQWNRYMPVQKENDRPRRTMYLCLTCCPASSFLVFFVSSHWAAKLRKGTKGQSPSWWDTWLSEDTAGKGRSGKDRG